MHNTRRKPDNADTLIPSRQLIYEVSHIPEFTEVRDAYEMALRNINGWRNVLPHHERLLAAGKAVSEKPSEDMVQWARGVPSKVIYNMAADVGKSITIEILWFVTSILQDNPSYFVFDTKRQEFDHTPEGMISRANAFCRFLATPKGRIMRKYAGASYLARY